ncbi:sensor histidine kinase [Paenibacillus allorhizosphaerae]|uniref:histidine kinase n=1 Tax=Paenibacillus allorhizosphaerae TaxID=2849866 RepID=A0ABN7TYR8_9BACL|nr:ATP-binding protein [Paenibacillus allorhizosphaerae]CAG7657537.1 Sensor histidine kinase RcsC [Paenibacillus allorhizosphaerae]
MKVSRKLFFAMAAFIVSLCVVFGAVTQLIVKESVEALIKSSRGEELESLSGQLVRYYENHNRSWEGIQRPDGQESNWNIGPSSSLLLLSPQDQILLRTGEEAVSRIKHLGIQKPLRWQGESIAVMYYYDPEVAMLSKLRIGIPISVLFLLIPSAVLFIGISLWVAWLLSKRLTAPLRQLIPVIDRLGKGEYGVRASATARDEYGQVARAFNEMAQLIQALEEHRRNMVADVAHELRTPITIIRGKLDLIQHSGSRIEPESLLPLQDELIRLTRLVDDLHQLSLAEAKKLPIERKATNVCELLRRIVDRMTYDADPKCIRIHMVCEDDLPLIDIDPNRMTQVFLNLIGNAVRYSTPGGSIMITIRAEPPNKGEAGYIRVAVADTGPGIDPQHLPYLFDRFYRANETMAQNRGGMGLGLAIAKGFVTAHHGTIDVESVLGQGTVFTIRLPVFQH